MQFAAVALTAFAAVAAAQRPNLYNMPPAPAPAMTAPSSSGNGCVDCASYCSDPSNGNALGAACYIVKCGIKCLVG